MDIKELIKSIDTEGVLDDKMLEVLVKNAEESITAKVCAAKEEGKKEGKEEALKEAATAIADAEKAGYEKGVKTTLTETELVVKEAEKAGYEAGVKTALDEAEQLADQYDTQVKEAVKELAETYDKYVDSAMTSKVQETKDEVTESIVEKVDKYLSTYIKEVIPESIVIDYDRINKLEKVLEVIKESVLVTDSDVQKKMKQLDESVNVELQKTKEFLKAEVQKRIIVEHKMLDQEAKILLVEKTQDLPAYEKNILIKKFTGKSVQEINESFDDTYTQIKNALITESEKQKTDVKQTIVEKVEEVAKKDDKSKVVTEAVIPTVNAQMAKYAELAGKTSKYSAK